MEIPKFFQTDSLSYHNASTVLVFLIFRYKKDRITRTPKSKRMTQKTKNTRTQKFNDVCSLLPMQASKYGKTQMKTKSKKPCVWSWQHAVFEQKTDLKTATVKMCCFKMKISGAVNGRSGGLKHNVTRFAASVQRTWCTLIQILHICDDVLTLILPLSRQNLYVDWRPC